MKDFSRLGRHNAKVLLLLDEFQERGKHLIVTHDMKLAHKVDRVVMISDGKISTEKILKQHYRDMLDQLESPDMTDETHEEYSVLDKAHRVQLSDDMLAAAGIDTNKVKVRIEDGRVVIEAEEKKE